MKWTVKDEQVSISREERKGIPGEKNMEKWKLVSEGVSRNCGSLIWVQ